jgi:predicted short-subunit dehydrogenase-like oxidoreductase (DUF2520 family)
MIFKQIKFISEYISMATIIRPTLAIIGAGRVGSSLAQSLYRCGYVVTMVYSRNVDSSDHLAKKLDSRVASSASEAASSAQLTFLTVPDDAIVSVCEALAHNTDLSGKAVVHTSGVSDLSVLAAAKASGAWVGGLHPMLAITDRDPDGVFSMPSTVPDVTFGVEAEDEPLHSWLEEIVHALNGLPLWLHPGQDRALYHAAGVIASNYMVTLIAEATNLLRSIDSEGDERLIQQTLVHLVEATLNNIKERGTTQALTGPIVRGDSGTVRKHLEALERSDPQLADIYRLLGLRTLRIATRLDKAKVAEIRENLEKRNAHDNS